MNMYGEKQVTKLDACFGSSLVSISIFLTLNIHLKSIHLVYIVILCALSILLYTTLMFRGEDNPLWDLWIMGGLSLVLYPFVDHLFAVRFNWVEYLTRDPRVLATPLYVMLYWVYGVMLFGYICLRVNGLTDNRALSGLVTGLFAAASAIFMENLFNAMGFYLNTPSHCMIGHVPVFVALGYIATFSLTPFYLRYRYISGFLLYGFIGLSWYISHHIVSWLVTF